MQHLHIRVKGHVLFTLYSPNDKNICATPKGSCCFTASIPCSQQDLWYKLKHGMARECYSTHRAFQDSPR